MIVIASALMVMTLYDTHESLVRTVMSAGLPSGGKFVLKNHLIISFKYLPL